MAERFSRESLRIIKDAVQDDGYKNLRPALDLPMLFAFLERFDHLGWIPPVDAEKRRLLAVHDVIMHEVHDDLCFYEFCSKGARGEREPWLTIFFHVASSSRIRIVGLERTQQLARGREFYLQRVRERVKSLSRRLPP
ncbi:MAG: hypothetical protein WBD40_17250 [Tepidisphaeraceae bacterium]